MNKEWLTNASINFNEHCNITQGMHNIVYYCRYMYIGRRLSTRGNYMSHKNPPYYVYGEFEFPAADSRNQ